MRASIVSRGKNAGSLSVRSVDCQSIVQKHWAEALDRNRNMLE